MSSLGNFFSFIFINSKINTILFYTSLFYTSELAIGNQSHDIVMVTKEAEIAKIIYKMQIRRYLGLGFFLSFIPGTEPFLARKILLEAINNLESLQDRHGNQQLIIGVLGNIVVRTFMVILYHSSKTDFVDLLLPKEGGIPKANRLNPFLYPTKLVFFIITSTNFLPLRYLFSYPPELPIILKIPVYPILFIAIGVLGVLIIASFILNLATELVLNSLHTLVVEPFIFAYEVIHQFVTNRGLDFAYMPTDDYKKVNRLANALGDQLINDAELNDSLKDYQVQGLTLIESTERVINAMEEHRNSFFFRLNKGTDLLEKDDETIADSYNQLTNLRKFSYFTQNEMPNVFPKEINQYISDICFQL